MKTLSGKLILTKKEIEGLKVVMYHSMIDDSYRGGGTFNKGDDNNTYDTKEAKKAILGREVISFILHLTE
jgi:hypothetical protein